MNTKEMIEVMQAYEDGKTIEYTIKDGSIWITNKNPVWNWFDCEYRVKKNWYDNIPEGGVLCRVWDSSGSRKHVANVTYVEKDAPYSYETEYTVYRNAEPLTQKEIEKFLDNAKKIGV